MSSSIDIYARDPTEVWADVDEHTASLHARSFLAWEGLLGERLQVRCRATCVLAWAYWEVGGSRRPIPDGWVIGGAFPFARVSGRMASTVIEALAIYALHHTPWVRNLGFHPEFPLASPYRMPPTWEEFVFAKENPKSLVTNFSNFIGFRIISDYPDQIVDPALYQTCQLQGWLPFGPRLP